MQCLAYMSCNVHMAASRSGSIRRKLRRKLPGEKLQRRQRLRAKTNPWQIRQRRMDQQAKTGLTGLVRAAMPTELGGTERWTGTGQLDALTGMLLHIVHQCAVLWSIGT